jgi:hypothetical protein
MDKVLVNQTIYLGKDAKVTAMGKAREDVVTTCTSKGYGVENIHCRLYKLPLLTNVMAVILNLRMMFRHPRKTEYLIQFPVSCKKSFPLVLRLHKLLGNHVTLLIHDIQSVRVGYPIEEDLKPLRLADELLVHTQAMKDWLNKHGITLPMRVLQLFDYYSEDGMIQPEELLQHKREIVFAGNLSKSEFLPALINHKMDGIHFNLYGLLDNLSIPVNSDASYRGIFESNHTGKIVGGWGLVWDGKSIEALEGLLGTYQHLISPHKLSLYISSGIPVIISDSSAEAQFVKNNNLGITVQSLTCLPEVISSVSDEEYIAMAKSCHKIGEQLRKGSMLKRHLK